MSLTQSRVGQCPLPSPPLSSSKIRPCRWLPAEVNPGACAQRPSTATPLSLPASKSMHYLCLLLTSGAQQINALLRRKEGECWGLSLPPPSHHSSPPFAFPLTWPLCEIFLWPPAEWSQAPPGQCESFAPFPTEDKSLHNWTECNFKSDILL